MGLLYDQYVHFIVWLGAAPPPGYEYLLDENLPEVPPKQIPDTQVRSRPSPPVITKKVLPVQPALTQDEEKLLKELRQNLMVKVLGNAGVFERLVAYERTLAPNASEIELLQNAIARWERDNR